MLYSNHNLVPPTFPVCTCIAPEFLLFSAVTHFLLFSDSVREVCVWVCFFLSTCSFLFWSHWDRKLGFCSLAGLGAGSGDGSGLPLACESDIKSPHVTLQVSYFFSPKNPKEYFTAPPLALPVHHIPLENAKKLVL